MPEEKKKGMSTIMVVVLALLCFMCTIGTMQYMNLPVAAIFLATQ